MDTDEPRRFSVRLVWLLSLVLVCLVIAGLLGSYALCWRMEPAPRGSSTRIMIIPYDVTAYCACEKCCGKWADGITASGYVIQPGDRFVAAPKSIRFGTMIAIPGYNNSEPVPVLDRGGFKGRHLDVYFDSHEEALEWGLRELAVAIYME